MGKYDARSLQMRREQIKLFDDGSECTVIISRPERRPLSFRKEFDSVVEMMSTASPPPLCFDRECKTEVRLPETYMLFKSDKKSRHIGMVVCPKCAAKSNEEILAILRSEFKGMGLHKPVDVPVSELVSAGVLACDVGGIKLAIVSDDDSIDSCAVGLRITELLEHRKLPLLAAFHGGHGNCHSIVEKLHYDLVQLGIEKDFTRKIGFSSLLKDDGEPIGLHGWIESDGWVIDCSNGAFGNPVWFERVESYYKARKMTDVRDKPPAPGGGPDAEGQS